MGYNGSIDRIQRIMKKIDTRSIITKKYCPTPTKEPVEERENLLKHEFTTTTINEKWTANITHIDTSRGIWNYLASEIYILKRLLAINLVAK